MAANQALPEEDEAWVKSYATKTSDAFRQKFKDAGGRFNDSDRQLGHFNKVVETVLAKGRPAFRAVDEAHNELCIAAAILSNLKPKFARLDYEPSLAGCAKSIDFRASTDDGFTVFVDVKTIKPMPLDRWEQFETATKEGWLPERLTLILPREQLGGELWHYMFAARSRMLEYTLELEEKIRECKLSSEKTVFVLALCGEGYYWHQDELEDFVTFYTTGSHRPDDPFSKAEAKDIEKKKIVIAKTVSRFACMQRPHGDIHYKRLNWHVRPPAEPSFAWDEGAI